MWLVKNLYDQATEMVRLDDRKSNPFNFEKGVRRGCLISPLLFNVAGEYIMRKFESNMPERCGKVIGGRAACNIYDTLMTLHYQATPEVKYTESH